MSSVTIHSRLKSALARDVPSSATATDRVRHATQVYDRMNAVSTGLDFLTAEAHPQSSGATLHAQTQAQATVALHFARSFLPDEAAAAVANADAPPPPELILAAFGHGASVPLEEVLGLSSAQTESIEQALRVLRTLHETTCQSLEGLAAELFLAVVQQQLLQALESPLPARFAIPSALSVSRALHPQPLFEHTGTELDQLLKVQVAVSGHNYALTLRADDPRVREAMEWLQAVEATLRTLAGERGIPLE